MFSRGFAEGDVGEIDGASESETSVRALEREKPRAFIAGFRALGSELLHLGRVALGARVLLLR